MPNEITTTTVLIYWYKVIHVYCGFAFFSLHFITYSLSYLSFSSVSSVFIFSVGRINNIQAYIESSFTFQTNTSLNDCALMDSLASRFVTYLLECRYIGPLVPGSVGITVRNLTDIYNTVSPALHLQFYSCGCGFIVNGKCLLFVSYKYTDCSFGKHTWRS